MPHLSGHTAVACAWYVFVSCFFGSNRFALLCAWGRRILCVCASCSLQCVPFFSVARRACFGHHPRLSASLLHHLCSAYLAPCCIWSKVTPLFSLPPSVCPGVFSHVGLFSVLDLVVSCFRLSLQFGCPCQRSALLRPHCICVRYVNYFRSRLIVQCTCCTKHLWIEMEESSI